MRSALIVTGHEPVGSSNGDPVQTVTCCSARIDVHHVARAVNSRRATSGSTSGRSVHLCNACTLSLAPRDPELRSAPDEADLKLPDEMPLIWRGRRLGIDSTRWSIYAPELMLMTIDRDRSAEMRHYLHGSADDVLERLEAELRRRLPGVEIVGRDAPPFRAPTDDEERALEQRFSELRPDLVWVGLGTPKQDFAVHRLAGSTPSAFVAVGAAFDFIAGTNKQAPVWMQERGLRRAYRLASEPRRMWRRYLFGNAQFIAGLLVDRPRLSGAR
jgi:N-acetylglucosaminyldiphosphoundecaprenol N-acetyl-beta-D-mannosaminyltransferase